MLVSVYVRSFSAQLCQASVDFLNRPCMNDVAGILCTPVVGETQLFRVQHGDDSMLWVRGKLVGTNRPWIRRDVEYNVPDSRKTSCLNMKRHKQGHTIEIDYSQFDIQLTRSGTIQASWPQVSRPACPEQHNQS